jgi:hypothetical protein
MNGSSSLAGWPEINDDGSNSLPDDGAMHLHFTMDNHGATETRSPNCILHFDLFLQFPLFSLIP